MNERAEIRQFILSRFANAELTDQQDIFDLGYVNSLFALELVLFVEKRFGIEVPNEELDIDNFRTIDAVAQLIERCAVPA